MSIQEIYRIANALAAEGKTPSVALIKNRLTEKVSMPTLIGALQRWKQDPTQTHVKVSELPETPPVPAAFLALLQPLQAEVAALRHEVAALRQQLEQLQQQQQP